MTPERLSILVVDDDEDIREVLAEVLRERGYDVTVAKDGADALDAVRKVTPSLILLDLNMPVMDGVELRRHLQADPTLARIPTIVMSAVDQMHARIAGLDLAGSVAKPLDLRRLLALIERHGARAAPTASG